MIRFRSYHNVYQYNPFIMTFDVKIFYQISILIYVALWAYFKYRPYKLTRISERPCVYDIEKYEEVALNIRKFGWLIVLILPFFLIFLFPEVVIVTQSTPKADTEQKDRFTNGMTSRQAFSTHRCYVPFYYKEHFCAPGIKYLSNETDSPLVLYPTRYKYGECAQAPSKQHFISIKAHSFRRWDKNISYEFRVPYVSHKILPDYNKPESEIKWTIDTESGAEAAINKIECELIIRQEKYEDIWDQASKEVIKNVWIR